MWDLHTYGLPGVSVEFHEYLHRHKSCLFDSLASNRTFIRNISIDRPIREKFSKQSAIKTYCNLPKHVIESIQFPIELKDTLAYVRHNVPSSNDIELEMHTSRISKNLYAVDLSWTCPSEWNGFPEMYSIVCARILHSKGVSS